MNLFEGAASPSELAEFEPLFVGPPLPAGSESEAERQLARAQALAHALGLPIGRAVDFWTEASLFSAAGLTALVYGPGDIAQAHAANEWVPLADLATVAQRYQSIIDGAGH